MGHVELTAWPKDTVVRPLICAFFLLMLTHITVLCALRIAGIGSWRNFCKSSLARKLILFTLIDSWLFAYASAVLLFGVGSSLNDIACEIGIWWCIILYVSSKLTIMLFLMERLHIVHSTISHEVITIKDRFQSWWYRVAFLLILGWIGVAILLCVGRNAVLHPDGTCKIGLKIWSTVPMLTMDAIINIFLTAGFVWPVFKAGFHNAKALAWNSCIAAIAALLTSFANICILAVMHGHQQSLVCLSSCVFDVAANATILFFITRHGARDDSLSGMRGGKVEKFGNSQTLAASGQFNIQASISNSDATTAVAGRRGSWYPSLYDTSVFDKHNPGRRQSSLGNIWEGVHIHTIQEQAVDDPETGTKTVVVRLPQDEESVDALSVPELSPTTVSSGADGGGAALYPSSARETVTPDEVDIKPFMVSKP